MRLTGIAFEHLRRGKGRASLVVAGLALGVATAVALAGVTGALERHLGEELDRYGANIVITPRTDGLEVSYGGVTVSGVSYEVAKLTDGDLERVRSIDYAERLAVVSPVVIGAADVDGRRAAIAGVRFEDELMLKRWWAIFGRAPASPDEVLVGYDAALALGVVDESPGEGELAYAASPVDDSVVAEPVEMEGMDHSAVRLVAIARPELRIDGEVYRVAGVLDRTGADDDRLVFADLAAAQRILGRPGELSIVEVSALCIECPIEEIVSQLSAALPDARVTAVQQAVASRSLTVARLASFGVALAAVVLVVAGLLVFVTMTSSVAERRREIGVLRAVGFRRANILRILGAEVAALGVASGLVGWAAGSAAAAATARYFTDGATALELDPVVALLAVGGAVLVGALGAAYPAWRAAKLDPTEALRYV